MNLARTDGKRVRHEHACVCEKLRANMREISARDKYILKNTKFNLNKNLRCDALSI